MNIAVDDDVNLFVQDIGQGRPVVFLPGMFMSHQVWDAQVRQLLPTSRTVAIDLRGHGLSSKPADGYQIARHVDDVVSVIDQLELTDVAMVGWSFGGAVAFGVAAARPQRVSQLVLVASNAVRFHPNDEFPFGVDPAVSEVMLAAEHAARPVFRHGALLASFHTQPQQPYLDWFSADSLLTPSWAGAQCLQALSVLDQVELIPAVTVPVLQIHGAQDPSWPIEGARWLATRLKDATLVELDQCGHFPSIEHQGEFDSALLSFLER